MAKGKKLRLWSGPGAGDYLFCTCDCTDFRLHGDVQQSRQQFESRLRRAVQPGEWVSIARQGDYDACLFGREIGLRNQPLAEDGWLVWWDDGSRHLITETHSFPKKRASKAEAFEESVGAEVALVIDGKAESESGKMVRYELRAFHEVVATPKHTSLTLHCCKHLIATVRFLFGEMFDYERYEIGWGYAQEHCEHLLMLNGQVAVMPLPDGGF